MIPGIAAFAIIFVFILFLIKTHEHREKCSKCGLSGTRELIADVSETSGYLLPEEKSGNGLIVLRKYICRNCGYIWHEVIEQEIS